jgi:alanine racemase
MRHTQMRTWAEISLKNLEHNYKAMRARLQSGTRFLGVVKADAYGHGAVRTARLLEELGCEFLGVACIDEALSLREAGVALPVLVMGYTPPELTAELIENNLTQTIYSGDMADRFSKAAVSHGGRLRAHLKVDTGMGRLGFVCGRGRDPEADMLGALALPGLSCEGIFTHFAVSEALGDPFTRRQFDDFRDLVGRLEKKSATRFEIKHCANSGAMLNCDWSYFDMVRPGLSLYGLYPGRDTGGLDLRPVMELKTRIAQIKEYEPGDTVSYGRTFTVTDRRRLAVITAGYGDGLFRVLSGGIDVLVRGRRARQVGRICMDMCMIDVSGIPETEDGDVVTIFGRDGGGFIPIEELSEKAGTISYELLCAVTQRVPRVYLTD